MILPGLIFLFVISITSYSLQFPALSYVWVVYILYLFPSTFPRFSLSYSRTLFYLTCAFLLLMGAFANNIDPTGSTVFSFIIANSAQEVFALNSVSPFTIYVLAITAYFSLVKSSSRLALHQYV